MVGYDEERAVFGNQLGSRRFMSANKMLQQPARARHCPMPPDFTVEFKREFGKTQGRPAKKQSNYPPRRLILRQAHSPDDFKDERAVQELSPVFHKLVLLKKQPPLAAAAC